MLPFFFYVKRLFIIILLNVIAILNNYNTVAGRMLDLFSAYRHFNKQKNFLILSDLAVHKFVHQTELFRKKCFTP